MNKVCTTIKQSRKLFELGIDIRSADMYYMYRHWEIDENTVGAQSDAHIGFNPDFYYGADNGKTYHYVPAWSLTALLGLIPKFSLEKDVSSNEALLKHLHKFKPQVYVPILFPTESKWILNFVEYENGNVCTVTCDNPVDTCYETILKLHELKML